MADPPVIALLGPTASGKSAVALELAARVDAEIITCDSAQVFRELDIGTAKPRPAERAQVPHHLIDEIPPTEQWTAAEFARRADACVAAIRGRGRRPILCGGTGLWYRAWLRGLFEAPPIAPALRARVLEWLRDEGSARVHARLQAVDPKAAARISPGDPQRIGRALEFYMQTGRPISEAQAAHGFKAVRHEVRAFALSWDRPTLWRRIEARSAAMYAAGLVEETRSVLASAPEDAPGLRIIGYRDAVRVVQGEIGEAEAREATMIATRQFAKRQRNWFQQESVAWLPGHAGPQRLARMVLDRSSPSD